MLTPLAQRYLEADVATQALVNILGRSSRAESVRRHLSAFRLAVARLELAELADRAQEIDPEDAVRQVIAKAIGAGLDWQALAAIFNTASDKRAITSNPSQVGQK